MREEARREQGGAERERVNLFKRDTEGITK